MNIYQCSFWWVGYLFVGMFTVFFHWFICLLCYCQMYHSNIWFLSLLLFWCRYTLLSAGGDSLFGRMATTTHVYRDSIVDPELDHKANKGSRYIVVRSTWKQVAPMKICYCVQEYSKQLWSCTQYADKHAVYQRTATTQRPLKIIVRLVKYICPLSSR